MFPNYDLLLSQGIRILHYSKVIWIRFISMYQTTMQLMWDLRMCIDKELNV